MHNFPLGTDWPRKSISIRCLPLHATQVRWQHPHLHPLKRTTNRMTPRAPRHPQANLRHRCHPVCMPAPARPRCNCTPAASRPPLPPLRHFSNRTSARRTDSLPTPNFRYKRPHRAAEPLKQSLQSTPKCETSAENRITQEPTCMRTFQSDALRQNTQSPASSPRTHRSGLHALLTDLETPIRRKPFRAPAACIQH